MEFVADRRAAFERSLDLSFALAKPQSICASLICGPWYFDYLTRVETKVSDVHIYEYSLYEALYQLGWQDSNPAFQSKTAFLRYAKQIQEKTRFDINLHLDHPYTWSQGFFGDIANFWDEVPSERVANGQVLLILDTCSVNTIRRFQSQLLKLQSGSVIMTNVSITRQGEERACKCEQTLVESLTNFPYQKYSSITYISSRNDGYSGQRRKLSVFSVE
jgi:hypothetical protein